MSSLKINRKIGDWKKTLEFIEHNCLFYMDKSEKHDCLYKELIEDVVKEMGELLEN